LIAFKRFLRSLLEIRVNLVFFSGVVPKNIFMHIGLLLLPVLIIQHLLIYLIFFYIQIKLF